MFRIYPQGQLTNGILNQPVRKLVVSQEKGQGLQLEHTQPGRVIMVAGGTGQFAFSDLIDLLYKEELIKENPDCQEEALRVSPVLYRSPLSRFQFEIILGVRKLEDVHPLTLQQLIFLGERKKMKVTLKVDNKPSDAGVKAEAVYFSADSYEMLLSKQIHQGSVSKVMISGPPIMNQIIVSFLRKKYYRTDLYLLV